MITRFAQVTAICIVVGLATASLLSGQSSAPYRITHTYPVGGDGSWDYVVPDPPSHRVYIGRENRVMVVDENDGKLLGEVTGIKGAHGVAIAAHTGHGFATAGAARRRPPMIAGSFVLMVIER